MALQNFVARNAPTIGAAWLNTVDRLLIQSIADINGVDSGVANAAVVTLNGTVTGFVRAVGSQVTFAAAAANTTAATLNVNGTGVAAIINQLGNALTGGELSYPVTVRWTGTAWQIIHGAITPDLARSPAEIATAVIPTDYLQPRNWVTRYGAQGNRTNDDLAAFNTAALVATISREIFIPPVKTEGHYYRLSGRWLLQDLDHAEIHGVGIPSLLVIANGAGQDCIELNSTIHATIRRIGIYGTSGSGSGINITNDSHYNSVEDVWVGWCDASGIRVTLGISNVFINCRVDQNNGFRPAALLAPLVDGSIKHGIYVLGTVTGRNNNQTFIGCEVNAAGETMSVQIGDGGVTPVTSCTWTGGLIQGSGNHRELYLVTIDTLFDGAHIEPPVGVSANWPVTLDNCTNTIIRNGEIQGDIRLIGNCSMSGVEDVLCYGIDFGASTSRCFVKNARYKNSTSGPAGGEIKDRAETTIIENLLNAGNVRFAAGGALRPESQQPYFSTNMEDWVVVGGVATVPCGFTSFGTPTITRSSSRRTGSFSTQVVCSTSLDEGFAITITPTNQFAGKKVTVEAWVFNVGVAGLGAIAMLEGGTGVQVVQSSFTADQWERMIVTFVPDAAATSVTIRFTGGIGTMRWDYISITSETTSQISINDLDPTSATPTISTGGRPLVLLQAAASATAVTGFSNPHTGQKFTIVFTGNRTINHGTPIFLNGAANFNGTSNDTLSLVYSIDGNFYEIGRAVI